MAIVGNFTQANFTQILNLLDVSRKSGTLHIDKPFLYTKERQKWASFSLSEHSLLLATLNGEPVDLIDMLGAVGKLNHYQMDRIRACSDGYTQKAIGLLLINFGYVTREEIIESVRQHTLEVLYEVMTWDSKTYFFEEDLLPPADMITAPVTLQKVLFGSLHRTEELKALEASIPLDMVLRLRAASERFRGLPLSVKEWHLISLVDSRTTLQDLAQQCCMQDIEIRRTVDKLLKANLVELVEPGRRLGVLPGPQMVRRFFPGSQRPL